MYIRRYVGRRAVAVAIQGFEVQVEPMSEVHDKVEREALSSPALIKYNREKRERHTWSTWNNRVGESSLGDFHKAASAGEMSQGC